MEITLKEYIRERVELLIGVFDEQLTVLSENGYAYVNLELINNTWDKHIKLLADFMGISDDSYELIRWFFLAGYAHDDEDNKIEDVDRLVDYIIKKNAE